MEQKNDSMRDRLLARLPQPENLAAYREETASLMAKHEKALFWERFTGIAVTWLAAAVFIMFNSTWGPKVDANATIVLDSIAGLLFFTGAINTLGYCISRSKVDLLKQVQIQLLEVQASLNKSDGQKP
jgi:hypothetical protein